MLKKMIPQQLVVCSDSTTVEELASTMKKEDVGAIVITDGSKRPIGIVTDRDIVLRCVSHGKDCTNTKAREVMTSKVETVSEEDSFFDIIKKVKASEVRRIPVVDSHGRAVGIVSLGDLLKLLAKELNDLTEGVAPERDKIREEAA